MILLVLYEDLASYFLKCISVFSEKYNAQVHIIHRAVNKEAPFKLELKNLRSYQVESYTQEELILLAKKINPQAIFCGGWSNKTYLRIIKEHKGKIPTVLGFDNQWEGSLKQQLARIIAPFYITNKFDKCFVPAEKQKEFARKIGFRNSQIAMGAYCCDFDYFYAQFIHNQKRKQEQFPRKFIYVGRYVVHKGIQDLWAAFSELQSEQPNDWELWCLGAGPVEPLQHPKIKHFGFIQPADLERFIKDTGVFILPSHFEPWGVVVHEFAAAGFPIICSDKVGARITFVENNLNGYIYASGNKNELKAAMRKMIALDDDKLMKMALESTKKAAAITPTSWAQQLKSLL